MTGAMQTTVFLFGSAALLGLSFLAIMIGRQRIATQVIYLSSFVLSLGLLACALIAIGGAMGTVTLPLGLPWIGAHFRIDPLASFFLIIVDLGAAAASFYGLGYGRHEQSPQRVLPFFPAFLAGMNLVILADDAFTFLLSWEFMSLASWALVLRRFTPFFSDRPFTAARRVRIAIGNLRRRRQISATTSRIGFQRCVTSASNAPGRDCSR